jgi:hypothetical protein
LSFPELIIRAIESIEKDRRGVIIIIRERERHSQKDAYTPNQFVGGKGRQTGIGIWSDRVESLRLMVVMGI